MKSFPAILLPLTALGPLGAQEIPPDTQPVTTASGLVYCVLHQGQEGPHPALTDVVTVHYTGWLESGKVFDSSRTRGVPAEFALGAVIEGWNEGVQLMTVGARYKFTIPSALAYGEEGRPPIIPANSNLIFDVELLALRKGPGIPTFQPLNPARSKVFEDGLKVEVLVPGEGEAAGDAITAAFHITVWDTEGVRKECTALSGQIRRGSASEMKLECLKRAVAMMRTGTELLCEVPPALAFGSTPPPGISAEAPTIWHLQCMGVLRMPVLAEDQWTRTEQGLEYHVLERGDGAGATPKMGDQVAVNYKGWLADGKLFDTSFGGSPAIFKLGQVIEGWNQGMPLMKPGDRFLFRLPPTLGYGARGAGPAIPPNATLVFEVQLLKVN